MFTTSSLLFALFLQCLLLLSFISCWDGVALGADSGMYEVWPFSLCQRHFNWSTADYSLAWKLYSIPIFPVYLCVDVRGEGCKKCDFSGSDFLSRDENVAWSSVRRRWASPCTACQNLLSVFYYEACDEIKSLKWNSFCCRLSFQVFGWG